jgi:hypothetical protein
MIYKIVFYAVMIILAPIYCAFFFSLLWEATVVQFFDAKQLSIQQAYCVTAISGFLQSKFSNEESSMPAVIVFTIIAPPTLYLVALVISTIIR